MTSARKRASDKAYYEANKKRINAAAVIRQRGRRKPRWPTAAPKSDQADRRYSHSIVEDMEYSADELEFFRAVDRFQTDRHEPFPTLRDLLRIVRRLGYRR